MLGDDYMPVYEAPEDPGDPGDPDDGSDGNVGDGSSAGRGGEEYNSPRQSYNFAPSYRGLVYRADVPDWGAGPRSQRNAQTSTDADDAPQSAPDRNAREKGKDTDGQHASADNDGVHYKLQTMKWGLVPSWTKRNPGYGSVMKTINCRDDSLAQSGGMWSSMKARKRCVVIAQGFYEWLKKDGGREKMPHYVRRKDGKLMCFAGLWDVVQYENDEEKQYTYTIITTDSNKQLNFLHDRMPVILDNGSEKMRTWLDPKRYEWSKELQSLLNPYDGELEVYPVSKDVGKVGNNSPAFIVPIDSKENKSNIANFFAKGAAKRGVKKESTEENHTADTVIKTEQPEIKITEKEGFVTEGTNEETELEVKRENVEDGDNKNLFAGIKREAEEELMDQEPPKKLPSTALNKGQGTKKNAEPSPRKGRGRQKISATSNNSRSPTKPSKSAGTQKITKFFANSS
ncbi:hypothetical protein E0Z10_g38 [Xylaria hypoxylon]|uniref:DUF159 domain protein n=1 Tax=Xylaria hypoxylon TaxID=37992 RepID=A0A4Z0ZCC3_9PEZI|nr:hypothetical protein E0Z10_g38 [Xylaria hypoxylon]